MPTPLNMARTWVVKCPIFYRMANYSISTNLTSRNIQRTEKGWMKSKRTIKPFSNLWKKPPKAKTHFGWRKNKHNVIYGMIFRHGLCERNDCDCLILLFMILWHVSLLPLLNLKYACATSCCCFWSRLVGRAPQTPQALPAWPAKRAGVRTQSRRGECSGLVL